MNLAPANLRELARGLSHAFALGEKVERVELRALNHVLRHTPEDMTVTVEAGITLAELQAHLAQQRQWLPIDPPNAEQQILAEVLGSNASGPRRFGYGTIRDYLLGIKVALADGRLIRSGGEVVKNVAGYDLGKLFIGSHDALGVIAEATFKLRPLPEAEQFVGARCESWEQADSLIESVLGSPLTPVVLDLHNLPSPVPHAASRAPHQTSPSILILGFAGTREEVDWQLTEAVQLGLTAPASLDYEQEFWADTTPARGLSVLPSKTVETLRRLNGDPFVARAGNGIIYHRGSSPPRKSDLPMKLMRRLKEAYDPKHILPELPL